MKLTDVKLLPTTTIKEFTKKGSEATCSPLKPESTAFRILGLGGNPLDERNLPVIAVVTIERRSSFIWMRPVSNYKDSLHSVF